MILPSAPRLDRCLVDVKGYGFPLAAWAGVNRRSAEASQSKTIHAHRHMTAIVSVSRGEGGGAESVLENLLRAWPDPQTLMIAAPPESRVNRTGWQVGAKVLDLDSRDDTLGSNLFAGIRLLPEFRRCGVLHAWSGRAYEIVAALGMLTRAPVTGTLHDHPRAGYIQRRRQALMRWTANRFAGLVCVSRAVAEECRKSGYRVPLPVILNGVHDFGPRPASPRSPRVGFLGMHDPDKGFEVVRPWIERVLAESTAEFALYGEIAPGLKASAQKLVDVAPTRVLLQGWRPTAEIYRDIDVLIHASQKFETYGMVLAEAACAGIPVVASTRGAESEVVVDGETGLLYPLDRPEVGLEHLRRLVHDTHVRRLLGRQARVRYEACLTAARMATNYATWWDNIACPARPAATGRGNQTSGARFKAD